MLVLLIIFMITAPLLTAAVPIDRPESRAKPVETEDQEPIQLSVGADDTLYIGEEVVPEAELPARLDAIAPAPEVLDRPRQLLLRAEKGLGYGRVLGCKGDLNRLRLSPSRLFIHGATSRPAAAYALHAAANNKYAHARR